MVPHSWLPVHRSTDDELVGYLVRESARTTPLTLFGYPLAPPSEPAAALAVLIERGLAILAEPWWLIDGDQEVEVRILEAFPDRVRVVEAPFGFYGPDSPRHTLAAPAARAQSAATSLTSTNRFRVLR
jgi:hypothetical protein